VGRRTRARRTTMTEIAAQQAPCKKAPIIEMRHL